MQADSNFGRSQTLRLRRLRYTNHQRHGHGSRLMARPARLFARSSTGTGHRKKAPAMLHDANSRGEDERVSRARRSSALCSLIRLFLSPCACSCSCPAVLPLLLVRLHSNKSLLDFRNPPLLKRAIDRQRIT